MENINKSIIGKSSVRIIKGVGISILTTFILLFIFSIILTFTNVQENTIKPVVIIISAISILIGSSLSSLKINKRGIVNGGIVGIIYILVIYLLSSFICAGFNININSVIMMILSILAGMLGDIIGVNL